MLTVILDAPLVTDVDIHNTGSVTFLFNVEIVAVTYGIRALPLPTKRRTRLSELRRELLRAPIDILALLERSILR